MQVTNIINLKLKVVFPYNKWITTKFLLVHGFYTALFSLMISNCCIRIKANRFGGDVIFNYRRKTWNLSAGASYQRNDIAGRREGEVYTIIDDIKTSYPFDGERSFDEINYSDRLTLGYTPDDKNDFKVGFYAGKRSRDRLANIIYYNN